MLAAALNDGLYMHKIVTMLSFIPCYKLDNDNYYQMCHLIKPASVGHQCFSAQKSK